MYEFAPTPIWMAPRHEAFAIAAPPADDTDGSASMFLDLGEGVHVLASEVIAVQALPEAIDFRRHFRKQGDPSATVMLRGGQVFHAFREVGELRAEWEGSLRVFPPRARVA